MRKERKMMKKEVSSGLVESYPQMCLMSGEIEEMPDNVTGGLTD